MIYVLNLNPSIDYHMHTDAFKMGVTNRSRYESVLVGGKGIIVSLMLDEQKTASTLLGFVGGFTGAYVQESLEKYALIRCDLIQTYALSRISVKLHTDVITEINGRGAPVTPDEIKQLHQKLEFVESKDIVVLSGSLANGMVDDWYASTIRDLRAKGIEVVVDIDSKVLKEVCTYQPFLIKPNIEELQRIFEVTITTLEDVVYYGKQLVDLGAKHCIVSMGSKGSVFISPTQTLVAKPIEVEAKNTVGAGDSMVAGFIASYVKEQQIEKAYIQGIAASVATVASNRTGTLDEIEAYLPLVQISEYQGKLFKGHVY